MMKRIKRIIGKNNDLIDLYISEIRKFKYIIAIPETIQDNDELFVETYNSCGSKQLCYEKNVEEAISDNGNEIEKTIKFIFSESPIMMPIVPDLVNLPDLQQLSFESIRDFSIHEIVFDSIQDAKIKVKEITGKQVNKQIFLHGYSASGVFAQRFALIYPELISRCLIGGAAGTIPVPIPQIKYPIGTMDYELIFHKKFNLDIYKRIKFGYYISEREEEEIYEFIYDVNQSKKTNYPMHDLSFREVTTPKDVGYLQRKIFGQTLNDRFKNSIEMNKKIGVDIEGIIIQGATHRNIFDSKLNRYYNALIKQLFEFYKYNTPLNPHLNGCCENIRHYDS